MVVAYAGLSLFIGAFGAMLIQGMINGDDGTGGGNGRGPNDQ